MEFCGDCLADRSKILNLLAERTEKSPYRKIELLGEGSTGRVWLVEEKQSGEQFAMKISHMGNAASEDERILFLREQSLASRLDHPNIVRRYDCEQTGDGFYILMEYLSGRSVFYRMRQQGGKFSPETATEIILQVLEGLAYAHSAVLPVKHSSGRTVSVTGLIHRNLTPGNILLSVEGRTPVAKVSDFDLRTALGRAGLSGNGCTGSAPGSPLFLCRKQLIDYAYTDPSADVRAAAACYYTMLTGRYVKDFEGCAPHDIFAVLLKNAPIPIRERDASIPPRLAEVIDHALSEEPGMGVGSAAELKKGIENAL
jgi:serine/threonine protein kinase